MVGGLPTRSILSSLFTQILWEEILAQYTASQIHSLSLLSPAMIPFEGSCPKTKPPPLLSLHRPTSSSLGGPNMRGPLSSHISHSGPSSSRGPLLHTAPPFHPGSRGLRGAPPSLKSARLPLLASPGGFLLPSNQLLYFTSFFFFFFLRSNKVIDYEELKVIGWLVKIPTSKHFPENVGNKCFFKLNF